MTQSLDEFQLLIVTGKGGVGKSVVAASLGRLMSARGRSVLVLEIDPRENIHQLLDAPPSGGEIIQVSPRLYLQHLDGRDVLDDLVRERLKIGLLVNRVLSSPVHQHFTEGAPGLKETAIFGRALRLLQGHLPRGIKKIDMVILDAPATGHGVSLLAAPRLVSDVIETGPIGSMAAEIATFMEDDTATGVVVVTTAEEMPVQEARELLDTMEKRLNRRPQKIIVNGLYPPYDDSEDGGDDPATTLWHRRRQINDEELARISEFWDGPVIELPLIPVSAGPALIGSLSRRLEPQLKATS